MNCLAWNTDRRQIDEVLPVSGSRSALFRLSIRESEAAAVEGFNLKFPPTKNLRGIFYLSRKRLTTVRWEFVAGTQISQRGQMVVV